MKQIALLSLLLVAAPALAQQPATAPKPAIEAPKSVYKVKRLSRADFDALASKPEQLLVIDVRRPDEIASIGSLPVFLNVQAKDLDSVVAWIPKDRKIVTVSNHANRSGVFGDQLVAKGFTVAGTIGTQDYEAEGGRIVKVEPPKKPAEGGAR